jgi:hypothetical protein
VSKALRSSIALNPSDGPSEDYVDPKSLEYSHGYTSYMDLDAPQKVKELIREFDKDPISACKALFGVWPTKQQADLINSAWSNDSRVAVSSCTGSGKTAALTWLTFLLLLCKYDCRILITSPSFQQLNRVFNSEANKWKAKMPEVWSNMLTITRERIILNAKKGVQIANIVTASAENEESLQGGHADNYVILADEASAINEDVFDVLQGTLSTGVGRFVLTSNPTRSSGRFYEIFHRIKDKGTSKWRTLFFSAFDCPHVNDHFIEEIADMYGEDSDQYRVRILGQFPRTSISQFIPTDIVEASMDREISVTDTRSFPNIGGVDIARQGDDDTVFVTRQGPKIIDITTYHGLDGPEVASKLLDYYRIYNHQVIFMDALGVGASPYDASKRLPGLKDVVRPLNVSLPSPKPHEYANVRAHLWGLYKEWLQGEVDMPRDPELLAQTISQTYGYNGKLAYLLTAKRDMKKQGITSPDRPDAVSFTFADKLQEVKVVNQAKRRVVKKRRRRLGW